MKKIDVRNLFFLLLLTAAAPLFAQDLMPAGMTTLANNVLSIFTGPFIRAIMAMLLCGCAIAYAYNKDNEKMKYKIIAIGIAIAIIVAAQAIVDAIWGAAT